jgi:hypothetical protein
VCREKTELLYRGDEGGSKFEETTLTIFIFLPFKLIPEARFKYRTKKRLYDEKASYRSLPPSNTPGYHCHREYPSGATERQSSDTSLLTSSHRATLVITGPQAMHRALLHPSVVKELTEQLSSFHTGADLSPECHFGIS